MFTTLQYRLLRHIAPAEGAQRSAAGYDARSKLKVLLGEELSEQLRDRTVIDFGCGLGEEAVQMAAIARFVYGLDIVPRHLEAARARAQAAGVADRCSFDSTPPDVTVDIIVSLDSFEHFADPEGVLAVMYGLLRPGGRVLASFGPPWYHPLGGHLFSVFPWAHLLFSEKALLRWRAHIRSDGATRFSEVEGGLNQMTIRRFERLVHQSEFRLRYLEAVPIRRLRRIHNRFTREFTTSIVRCVLERPDTIDPD